jgi:hypothetical protein
LAWEHHQKGAYEASVPIVLAQVDGITHDATACAETPTGRSSFSTNPARQADVADNETLAGIEHGLPAVRDRYSEQCVSSGARGTAKRHGVMHGRELRYDTRINSTKSFVLLLAIWEWASRRLAAEAARRKEARYAEQAALKLVLEPIFEADFRPCSHGFRPGRRAHDAIAEIRHLTSVRYEWVLEGDITACFDEIDHTALLDRVRHRVGDKRVVALVKAFLKAGVLTEDGIERDTDTGTPQGGILSPLLANIALSVLDDHFAETWQNEMATTWQPKKRRNHGRPNYRLIRYADDFVVVIHGERSDAEALRQEVAAVLGTVGLRLSETSTRASTSSDGASSVTANEARPSTSSTPTPRRPPSGRSRRR